jgi:taurine--2-oxoglutarate transaminase
VIAAMKEARTADLRVPGPATEVRARSASARRARARGHQHLLLHAGRRRGERERHQGGAQYTGRQKILSRYRSYHGGTNATMQLTGDPRRWPNEPGMPGVIRVMDPQPYTYSFGTTDEEIVANNLTYLEEVIMYEGPQTIAAMFIETVTGTNGILPPPKGYLQGLRRCSTSTASC